LFVGALVAEHVELLEDFSFLGVGPAADEEDLLEAEGTGAADDVADVVAFADVVQQQVPFGFVLFHLYKLQLSTTHTYQYQSSKSLPLLINTHIIYKSFSAPSQLQIHFPFAPSRNQLTSSSHPTPEVQN